MLCTAMTIESLQTNKTTIITKGTKGESFSTTNTLSVNGMHGQTAYFVDYYWISASFKVLPAMYVHGFPIFNTPIPRARGGESTAMQDHMYTPYVRI